LDEFGQWFLEGRAFVWVDELNGNVEFAVLHHNWRGLWFEADSCLPRCPFPLVAEVDPLHRAIERIGYSVPRIREVLLAMEVSDQYRWWVLYLRGSLRVSSGFGCLNRIVSQERRYQRRTHWKPLRIKYMPLNILAKVY
jgi:hypothetical protein